MPLLTILIHSFYIVRLIKNHFLQVNITIAFCGSVDHIFHHYFIDYVMFFYTIQILYILYKGSAVHYNGFNLSLFYFLSVVLLRLRTRITNTSEWQKGLGSKFCYTQSISTSNLFCPSKRDFLAITAWKNMTYLSIPIFCASITIAVAKIHRKDIYMNGSPYL